MRRFFLLFLLVAILMASCQTTASSTPVPSATSTDLPPMPTETALEVEDLDQTPTPSCPRIEGELLTEMQTIEDQVIQLRGLQPARVVERKLFTSEDLRLNVTDDFLADYTVEEAQTDSKMLFLLGLLPQDFDLRQLYIDLLNEQVAGFYDTELEEMVVICGVGFGGMERLTYAHEYVHTLQDQRYDFETGLAFSDAACEDDSQRCVGTQALFEGDATLLQEQWLRQFATEQDLEEMLQFFSTFAMPVYESAPEFIQDDFTFPYLQGLFFVRSLYLQGGWAAVDNAYLNPPQSAEQILHPERYPQDEPVMFEPPDLSSLSEGGWEVMLEDVLGEWLLRKMLETHLPKDEAETSAAGWGGDIVLMLENATLDDTSLLLLIQWDTMRDAHEFVSGFKQYGELRFGEADQVSSTSAEWSSGDLGASIERLSNQTLILLTSSSTNLETLQTALSLPLRARP